MYISFNDMTGIIMYIMKWYINSIGEEECLEMYISHINIKCTFVCYVHL